MNENHFEFDETSGEGAIIHIIGAGRTGLRAVGKMAGRIHKVECIVVTFTAEDYLESNTLPIVNLSATSPDGALKFEHLINITKNSDLVFLVTDLNEGITNQLLDVCTAICKPSTTLILVLPETIDNKEHPVSIIEQVSAFRPTVDGVIIVSEISLIPLDLNAPKVFGNTAMLDHLLRLTIERVTEIITTNGLMCIDFADVLTVIRGDGVIRVGIGLASGKDKGNSATNKAFGALKQQNMHSIAKTPSLLCCITGSGEMTMDDYNNVNRLLHSTVNEDTNIKIGITHNDEMGNNLMVVLWAVEIDHNF